MKVASTTPLFVDTGAFYARADEDDQHHETASNLFDDIRSGTVPYRPIFTSQSVRSEFTTLALYRLGHETAARALRGVRDSQSINVLPVGEQVFATAREQFEDYDDQQISFVGHTSSVLADEHDIDRIFAFDSDFRTLGFTVVPEDVESIRE